MPASINVQAVGEGASISPISKRVMALMFLVTMIDAYDQIAMTFAAPSLIAEWGIDKAAMGHVFSIQMFGLLVGGIGFGVLGDRIGRKLSIILGMLLFGLLSLATMATTDTTQLLIVRFFVGVGVGGVLPNAIALSNEFAPKHFRVTAVSLMYVGYVCGALGSGAVAAWMLPRFGWEVIFLVGGIVPILVVVMLFFALPESVHYLATRDSDKKQAEATRIAALMRPELDITPQTRIVNDVGTEKLALRELFAGPLKVMTILLWLIYVANSTTSFALLAWMPILIRDLGFLHGAATLSTSLMFVGAAIGGVAAARLTDRGGLGPIVLMPAIGLPFMVGLGFVGGGSAALLYLVSFGVGFFVAGFQNNLHGVGASIYPARIRAMGVGWAMGANRIGGIIGPSLAGYLMFYGWSSQAVCVAISIPLLVSVGAVAMLSGLYQLHVRAARPGQPALETAH
jgi:AAHS family 4-hydroxybenzoate transporter-like MFS transporter